MWFPSKASPTKDLHPWERREMAGHQSCPDTSERFGSLITLCFGGVLAHISTNYQNLLRLSSKVDDLFEWLKHELC